MPPTSSPRIGSSTAGAPLMRRQSSQSSQTSKHGVQSPGSVNEHQPLRPPVKPARRTKIVLPRNHSSGRDLTKLARQAQNQYAGGSGRRTSKQKSHEGDTEIRLPGSLDESKAPPMRRNMTAYQLPRNTSHTKLKKNLSHGQLTRIGSGKNLVALNSTSSKGPPSPGQQKRNKRPKSADMGVIDKDLHEQEVELAQKEQEKKEAPKRVGFAVGSSGDDEGEDAPDMEGSGMQEDEWTDQSNSASPYSTRQNTANNSRRASVTMDRPPDKHPLYHAANARNPPQSHHAPPQETTEVKPDEDEADEETSESDDESEPPTPLAMPQVTKRSEAHPDDSVQEASSETRTTQESPMNAAKEHTNPATRHLLARSTQNTAPALVSNVSALNDARSARGPPAASMRSSRSNIGDGSGEQDQDELVSRFVPSASHPSTGSGGNTTMNTPKIGSFQTPENESTLAAQNRDKAIGGSQRPPISPGSTISGSSGAATPAMGRSRTELRMLNEKAIAEMEDLAARQPMIPPHVYDRRNESLKSYLNLDRLGGDGRASFSTNTRLNMGQELFQGRFKAVNTEFKVVQRFHEPIRESVSRLKKCKGKQFTQLRAQKSTPQKQVAKMPISKSATSLAKQPSKLSTSMSPPKSASPVKPAMSTAKSSVQIKVSDTRRSKVTFSQTPPETREVERNEEDGGADAIARQLWDMELSKVRT